MAGPVWMLARELGRGGWEDWECPVCQERVAQPRHKINERGAACPDSLPGPLAHCTLSP